ncbi:uncharacterized protein [Dendropsophus ebraccatus]|uniref:uncharacterized protein n=1 Tax=Dendropsophus ebraccatus TaxID=150705 RepID=UPI00383204DB
MNQDAATCHRYLIILVINKKNLESQACAVIAISAQSGEDTQSSTQASVTSAQSGQTVNQPRQTTKTNERHQTCAGRGRGAIRKGAVRTPKPRVRISNDLLIQMVQERSALWDHTDPAHSDHHLTQSLWDEVRSVVIKNWNDLSEPEKKKAGKNVIIRWRSMRDRYIRDFHKEQSIPSGSGATRRNTYRYMNALDFLRRCAQLRLTVGSARDLIPEGATEDTQAETIEPHSETPDLVSTADNPTQTNAATSSTNIGRTFSSLLKPGRSGRRRPQVWEEQIRVTREALLTVNVRIEKLKEEFFSRITRLESNAIYSGPLCPTEYFFKTIIDDIRTMTPDQQYELRNCINSKICEILQRQNQPFRGSLPQPYQPRSEQQSFAQQPHPYAQPMSHQTSFQQSGSCVQPMSHQQTFRPISQPQNYHLPPMPPAPHLFSST